VKVDGNRLVTLVGPLVIVVVMESLGEDLVLLSIRPDKARIGNADKIDFGLMGSELVRLAALGRVNVTDERIVVLDAAPTGDPELDAALRSLTGARRPPKATAWVGQPRRGIRDAYLARLAQAGVIQIEPARFLGIPVKPLLHLADSGRAAEAIALSSGPVDATQAAYGGLTHATGLAGLLYRGRDGRPARDRLAEVAKGRQAGMGEVIAPPGAGQARTDDTGGTAGDAVAAAADAAAAVNRAATQAAVDAANAAAIHAAVHAANHAAAHAGGAATGGHGH
jgi:Golgi phosphoprotein 3 (GPP34)